LQLHFSATTTMADMGGGREGSGSILR